MLAITFIGEIDLELQGFEELPAAVNEKGSVT